MHVLRIECTPAERDRLAAELWERGTVGIIEQDHALEAFFDAPFDPAELGVPSAQWALAEERDWVAVAQSQWEPMLAGEKFFLVPGWRGDPTPPGRIRLEMESGLACGSGLHPATQLALEAMERWLRPGAAVLDLGTGSGILAVAAARLGAARVFACDIDPEAARVARGRIAREGLEVGLFAGSIRSLRPGTLDAVVANINAETVILLAPEIRQALEPRGVAILCGFQERKLAGVQAAFGAGRTVLRKEDWAALVC